MINICFDTEFTDFVIDPALISIGLVADDGREFYAELNDTYEEVMCSWFVLEAVLPILWRKEHEMSSQDLAHKLKAWIDSFGERVILWADSPSYDWPWIQDIFERSECGWPDNLVRQCKNTQVFETDTERLKYNKACEDYWRSNKVNGAMQHHALWDARCIRQARSSGLRESV